MEATKSTVMAGMRENSPSWINRNLYPFTHHFIKLSGGTMHYVDEGEGDVILFIHGTPTWSFLYRDFIKYFSKTSRCIAIDHIGFGLSEKPTEFAGTPQVHTKNLLEFIERLSLEKVTLVVHDFGGPIGLSAAMTIPEKIAKVVLFNSWLWETRTNVNVQKVDKLLSSWLGKVLYLNINFSPKFLFKNAFNNKYILQKEVHHHYINPFPNRSSRLSLLRLGKSLFGASDWYGQQKERLPKLKDKPWLIMWGTKDKFITSDFLDKWVQLIPHSTMKEFDCGHFVQEEKTMEAIKQMSIFISKTTPA